MTTSRDTDLIFMTTATAKPGLEGEIHEALSNVARAGRAQAGCVDYRVLSTAEDPAVTVNVERWSSRVDRDAFLAGAAVKEFASAVAGAFAGPPRPLEYTVLHEA